MEQKNVRAVYDLPCVAYLLTIGYEYDGQPFWEGHQINFAFQNSPQLEKDIQTFYDGKARVNPIIYGDHLRRLRSWLRELRKSREVSHEK